MSGLVPVTAKDEAYRFFTDRFTKLYPADQCEMRYQGKAQSQPEKSWGRLSMQQVQSPLSSFMATDDGEDAAIYETSGLIFFDVYVPIANEDGFRNGDLIATAARDIFRGAATPSGMWFRNARFSELPSDGQFYRWRVIAEYEYDERERN